VVSDAATVWNPREIASLAAFGKRRLGSRQVNVGASFRRTRRFDGVSRTCACIRTTIRVPALRVGGTIVVCLARLSWTNTRTVRQLLAYVVALRANARLGRVAFGGALIAAVIRCLAAIRSPCAASGVGGIRAIQWGRGGILFQPAIGKTSDRVVGGRGGCVLDKHPQHAARQAPICRANFRISKVRP